jgi:hypothetical protein
MGFWSSVGGAVKDKYSEYEAKRDAYAEEYKSKSTDDLKRICDQDTGARCAGARKVLLSRGIDY